MTATTTMSLHRVIAEIKNLEAKLTETNSAVFVTTGIDSTNKPFAEANKEAKEKSQAALDRIMSNVANLATLKSARNKANSEIVVTISGKQMTIDEALAMKAAVHYRQEVTATIMNQFNIAQRRVDVANQAVEQKVNTQMSTVLANRTVTQEEMVNMRTTIEKDQKQVLIFGDNVKTSVDRIAGEVESFLTQVDFVLSEANATNTVEVSLV